MPEPPIYLFKSARRPIYRKENLDLLAAERGSVQEYAWNRTWVSPGFFDEGSIARGRPVYIVFTDRPFDRFVPVRDGEIADALWDETLLRLKVILNNPVAVPGDDLDAYTARVKAAAGNHIPGEKFVVPKADDVELRTLFEEEEIPGWRRSIDEILAMSRASEGHPYERCVFFRPGGIRMAGGELLPTRRVPLEPGTSGALVLHFHNPHLTEDDLERVALRLHAPPDALRTDERMSVPRDGEMEVAFETLDGPEPSVRIEVSPGPTQHTSVLQRMLRAGEERRVRVEAGGAGGSIDRERVRHLYELIGRKAVFEADDELDVLEAFAALLPDEHDIAERRALLLLAEGREADARDLLGALNPELLGDEARRFLFRQGLLRQPDREPFEIVEAYQLTTEQRFGLLVEEMEALPERTLDRLVPSLVGHLPEATQRQRIIDTFGYRLTTPAAATETAANLYAASDAGGAEHAFRYLDEMRRRLGTNDRGLVDVLIQLVDAAGHDRLDPELRRVMEVHVTNLIGMGRYEDALAELRKVSTSLGRHERRNLYHLVADRYEARARREDGAQVMLELAWESMAHGHLDDATEAVERARGLWSRAGHEEASPEIRDTTRRVTAAWKDVDELVQWRKTAEERLRERLRERLLNQSILVAGGLETPEWVEHLENLTGARVDWCQAYRDETDDLEGYAERIRNGHYTVVLHYLQKTGHGTGEVLKPACEEAGVPFLSATSAGRRGLVEGLEGWAEG